MSSIDTYSYTLRKKDLIKKAIKTTCPSINYTIPLLLKYHSYFLEYFLFTLEVRGYWGFNESEVSTTALCTQVLFYINSYAL